MKPMLDDMELPQVQEITTFDRRMLAEYKPPGMAGSLLQNMGRQLSLITLWGVVTGSESIDFLERLDGKFREGIPVAFVSDIVTDAEIEQLLIDDLKWRELAGKPQRFAYTLKLREYIEPVEPEDASLLDADILEDAENLIDDLIEGLDLGLNLPTGLEQFVSPLEALLARFQQFREDVD